MTGRCVGNVSVVSLLLLFHLSSVSAEVLFGPVFVPNGQVYTGTFPMYCRCTAYFLEVTSQMSKAPTILLNGEQVLRLTGEEWRQAAVQVELREDAANEIEIRVGRTQGREGATVQVYEREVTPAPMVGREYVKDTETPEAFFEAFVLNHWANRFVLRVENGDPEGNHRVTSGTVVVNGTQVLGPEQVHGGVAEADAEVELRTEGLNRVRVRVEGPAGSKIRIGIEEPAQTVTVTEVACATPPGMVLREGIGTFDGELLFTAKVRGKQGSRVIDKLVEIDGEGAMREVVADSFTTIMGLSPNGGYALTSTLQGEDRVERLYGPDRNVVEEFSRGVSVWEIADNGTAFLGLDMSGGFVPRARCGAWFKVQGPDGTVRSLVPASPEPPAVTFYFSPDGQYVGARCDGRLSVYRSQDGSLAWERDELCRHALANEGRAVQATRDTLYMIGSDGMVERRVINESSPAWDCGSARTTPDGDIGVHNNGTAIVVARRWGPQSCWKFAPQVRENAYLGEDGRWLLVRGGGYVPGSDIQRLWLVTVGAQVLWEASDLEQLELYDRPITSAGFAYSGRVPGTSQKWYVFRIDVE